MSDSFPFEHFFKNDQKTNGPKKAGPDHLPLDLFSHLENDKNELSTIKLEKSFHEVLKKILPIEKYNAYFERHLKISSFKDKSLELTVSSDFIKFMIEGHFFKEVIRASEETIGTNLLVKIEVENKKNNDGPSSNKNNILKSIIDTHKIDTDLDGRPKKVSEVKFSLNTLQTTKQDKISTAESTYIRHLEENKSILLDTNKTFETFIVGPSNNLAFTIALTVAKGPNHKDKKGPYPSLFIYGNSGLGKSHLLHATANYIKGHCPNLLIYLISGRDFISEFVNALSSKNTKDFQEKYYEKIDVLIIDDIHEISGKNETQNEFFHIFNLMMQKGKQLIFTADKRPSEIKGLSERIQSRLQGCLLVDIQKPDFETRMAILKKRMLDLDIFISEDILAIIAGNIQNNIRELEGALIGLHAQANILNKNIDEVLVKELLSKSGNFTSPSLSIEQICKLTSLYYKIPLPDLKSRARNGEISKARHIAMYLIKKHLQITLLDIAVYFGGRDHSSVIHAINKIKIQEERDSELARDISLIESNFQDS